MLATIAVDATLQEEMNMPALTPLTDRLANRRMLSLKLISGVTLATLTFLTVGFSGPGCSAASKHGYVEAHKLIAPGQKAPDFSLTSENGKTVKLTDFQGKRIVLFFYDKDNSPVTTEEHHRIQKSYDKFKLAGVDVLCIGPDPVASHKAMNTQLNLNYHLLSDKDDQVRYLYGLPPAQSGARGRYGILVNKDGIVKKVVGGTDGLTDASIADMLDYVMSTQGSGF